jgi:hypothetical protein
MYSYMGQGSPAVLEYQYGTERYVRDDRFLSGIGVETFNPYPQVHRQPQNDPQLHRQNIQKSGMMPMQKGQANLFPVQGKGQSYASSNLDSYITDKHSSTHNFSELESLGYLRNTNTDEDQIKMLYRMGKFQDVRVKRYVYRIFDNGLIQIISPSPFMVGRIISEQKRPKLYHSILKSILGEKHMYGNILQTISESTSKVQETADNVQGAIDDTKNVIDSFSSNNTSFLTPQARTAVFSQRLVPNQPSLTPQARTAVFSQRLVPNQPSLTPQQQAAISQRLVPDSDETSNLQKVLMIGIPIGLGIIGYKFLFSNKKRRK